MLRRNNVGYIVCCNSDIGIEKKVNQDAIAFKQIKTLEGEVVFAILCDGMGGFSQGEIASTTVVMAYLDWFENIFLKNIGQMNKDRICVDWELLMQKLNNVLFEYANSNGIKIGTTLTILLLWNNERYIYNVGDGRVYELTNQIVQITKDHSWVAGEVEEGRMTPEQANFDSRKNRILKCIGGAAKTSGDFFAGKVVPESVYLMCCDGVRNKVFDEELHYFFHPTCMNDSQSMENNIKYIFELNKLREEKDNMSMIVIKDNDITMNISSDDFGRGVIKENIIVGTDRYIKI